MLTLGIALVPATAGATKHHAQKHPGVRGVVFDATCPGACAVPPPPQPVYAGAVTVTVRRAGDGAIVASQAVSDGHFKLRVKRGSYDVSSVPPNPPTCDPRPGVVCSQDAGQAAIARPCLTGETKRVQLKRHRFTYVELHVTNVCIV
jgi:hypothetical protein